MDGICYLKKVDGCRECKDPESGATIKVVYEYHGCFSHSCHFWYNADEAHPLKCEPSDFEGNNVVFCCEMHVTTRKIQEDIPRSAYKLVEKWEMQI